MTLSVDAKVRRGEPVETRLSNSRAGRCLATRVGRSICKRAPLNDGEKARLLSERIPFGVDDQQDEAHVMRVVGALQAFQGGRSFVEAGVQESQCIWRHVLLCQGLPCAQDPARVGSRDVRARTRGDGPRA